ncbi:ankyrin repeat domain-containing protein [Phytomonospora sp. NPDC050363]|uniref:ankyrin repeat domain-containing protein n=1 Tax=Phytomonospora sp. NPDC050363 TaxID=3155642 RepID=UPI0033DDD261
MADSQASRDPELAERAGAVFDMARTGDTARLAAYVDSGVSADLADGKGDTLLMLAAYHGHVSAVRMLLEHGADPNVLNGRGQSPLAGAVFKAEAEVVRTLLDGGADPEIGVPSATETARMFEQAKFLAWFRPSS